jgi:hypothetical protein
MNIICGMVCRIQMSSAGLGEADDFSVLAEAFPAEEQVVFADEADLAAAATALAAVLAELAGVGSPE